MTGSLVSFRRLRRFYERHEVAVGALVIVAFVSVLAFSFAWVNDKFGRHGGCSASGSPGRAAVATVPSRPSFSLGTVRRG